MNDNLSLRIKLGDEKAFELLFRKYYPRLCGFANKFLNNSEEAEEIVRDVFLELWEGRKKIEPEESLNAYLFKITQNKSINILRRKKVESKYIDVYKLVYAEHIEITPYQSLLGHELEGNITIALSKIPSKCRKIFELSRVKGLKYNEIAATLQISVKTVEAHMSKALQILRYELKDYL